MYIEVILNNKVKILNRTFDYIVPENMKDGLNIGSRVLVPFGRSTKDAYVIGFKDKSYFECKEILEVLTTEEISEEKLALAKIMSKRYFCNLSECIKLMLNPKTNTKNIDNIMKNKMKNIVVLAENYKQLIESIKLNEGQKEIVSYLESLNENNSKNNTIELKDLNEKFSTSRVSLLIRKGILKKEFEEVKFEEYNFWDEELEEEEKRAKEIEKKSGKKKEIVLNEEQQEVYDKFKSIVAEELFSEELLYGVTGSRKNRNIFKNNKRCTRYGKKCNCTCSRNSTYSTNCKKVCGKIPEKQTFLYFIVI